MNKEKFTTVCDKVMTFSLCALVYFLPISIALVETFTAISIFFFLLKRGFIFYDRLTQKEARGLKGIAKLFVDSYKPKENDLNLIVWLLIFFHFISVITSTHPGLSFKGFMGKTMENTFVFFAFVEVINSRKRLKIFLTIYLLSVTLTVVNGLYQLFVGKEFIHGEPVYDKRIASSFRAPNDFAAYLVLIIPLLISMNLLRAVEAIKKTAQKSKEIFSSPLVKSWLFILLLISLMCLILTSSRGAWVGFIISFAIFALRYPKLWPKLGALFIFIAICGFISICFNAREDLRTISGLFNTTGRWVYWVEAANMIKDYPIFGCGFNAYSVVGKEYKIFWGGYPHNCFLQIMAETGIVGLSVFLWLLWTLFYKSFKAISKFKSNDLSQICIGALAGLLGFFVHAFGDTTLYSVILSVLMWLYFGIVIAAQKIDASS